MAMRRVCSKIFNNNLPNDFWWGWYCQWNLDGYYHYNRLNKWEKVWFSKISERVPHSAQSQRYNHLPSKPSREHGPRRCTFVLLPLGASRGELRSRVRLNSWVKLRRLLGSWKLFKKSCFRGYKWKLFYHK